MLTEPEAEAISEFDFLAEQGEGAGEAGSMEGKRMAHDCDLIRSVCSTNPALPLAVVLVTCSDLLMPILL